MIEVTKLTGAHKVFKATVDPDIDLADQSRDISLVE